MTSVSTERHMATIHSVVTTSPGSGEEESQTNGIPIYDALQGSQMKDETYL